MYIYIHIQTTQHTETKKKIKGVGGGLNRTQKTPLDMDWIFRSNWCFYHG